MNAKWITVRNLLKCYTASRWLQKIQYTPKNGDRENLLTWIRGDGGVRKQLDYYIISKNIETWLNYSKAKWAENPNQDNQHNLICVGIRAKLKQPNRTPKIDSHINFAIKQLRGKWTRTTHGRVWSRGEFVIVLVDERKNSIAETRRNNNKPSKLINIALWERQKTMSPLRKDTRIIHKGNAATEIANGWSQIAKKQNLATS